MTASKLRGNIGFVVGGLLTVLLIVLLSAGHRHIPEIVHLHDKTEYTPLEAHNDTVTLPHDLLNDIDNSTLGFEKILVINLPSRTDHRDALSLAATLTGLELDFIDGVSSVENKTLPPGSEKAGLRAAELGNWRAHLNAALYIVENNIQSALVLEDDIDWDIRIKEVMRKFARATQLLVQPATEGTEDHLDPTWPDNPEKKPSFLNLYVDQQDVVPPITSPYGDIDRWDLLAVGHCGTYFPQSTSGVSMGRAIILHDETVPEPQHIEMQFADHQLQQDYPPHTRLVARAHKNTCSIGYALSQQGARKFLYTLGLVHIWGPTDMSIDAFCDGSPDFGVPPHICLTSRPQIFQHHRPVGKKATFSDISAHGDEMNKQAFTRNIRWSTRLNIEKLLTGETDYVDLFQDGAPAHDYGWG